MSFNWNIKADEQGEPVGLKDFQIYSPRRLAAILAADIDGYSRLMEFDEEGTLARVKRIRREIIEPTLAEHQGRLIKTTGDGFLAVTYRREESEPQTSSA